MRFILPMSCVLLTACPSEPKEGTEPAGAGTPVAGAGQDGEDKSIPANAGEPGPSAEALLQHKQADLEGQPNTITISGEVKCVDGSGPFWIHLFPPPDDPNNPDEGTKEGVTPPGPITGLEMTAPGTFSIKAPKGGTAMLLAFEDVDKDGFPGAQEPVFFFEDRRSISLDQDQSDMSLTCFKLMSPAPDEIGPPPGGEQDPGATPGAAERTPPGPKTPPKPGGGDPPSGN